VQQLAALLVQQDALIREQERRLQLVLEQWRAIKAKEQGFSRLLQRLDDQRQLAELQNMQKEMDAWALRATQLRGSR
jgi:flagellar biosynthesis chaperone FliJ